MRRRMLSMIRNRVFQFATAFLILAILPSVACAQGDAPDIIKSVSPVSAKQGESFNLTVNLQDPGQPPLPPSDVIPASVKIGTIEGTSVSRNGDVVTANFTIPSDEMAGTKNVSVVFPAPPDLSDVDEMVFTETGAFEVIGETGSLKVTLEPAGAVTADAQWKADGGSWQDSGTTLSDLSVGSHTVSFKTINGWTAPSAQSVAVISGQTETATGTYTEGGSTLSYPIVDTGQDFCSSDSAEITCPSSGEAFYGQDAQHAGYQFSYESETINGGKVVNDLVTGLMWQQTIDTDGDGDIDASDKKSLSDSKTYCENLTLAGHTDWRLPNIKELYSLIDFRGGDCSGYEGSDTSTLTPFIDNTVFDYDWGDTAANERLIDSQYASDTEYVDTEANDGGTLFGVNFADGRIKGYELVLHGTDKTFFCQCVRSNTSYGVNNFTDNGDDTITDNATGLMWSKNDSGGSGLNWEDALAWVETQNTANHNNWRMPNAKELQSILDYTLSPATSNSAAIDPLFNATKITNEANQDDYPYYWTSTTHLKYNGSVSSGVYISFGRAIGDYGKGDGWQDVHGAGAQRSDPKSPADGVTYPNSNGPQGDAQRVYNYVRLVRDAEVSSSGETGSLTVTISPQEAIDAGSQWKADSGSWQNSGASVSDLTVGTHTVSFKTVSGWTAPASQTVTITADSTKTLTGTYTEDTTEQTIGVFIRDEEKAFEGYTLFAPMQSTTTYLMNNEGNFVYSWESDYNPGLSVYLLESGNLLRTASVRNTVFDAGGSGGKVQEIEPDGNVAWEFDHSGAQYLLHHDVEYLPNGNVLMIAWEYKSEADTIEAGRNPSLLTDGELWPDKIIEVEPASGNIVWEWHVWDHLIQDHDDSKPNHGTVADHPELIDLNYVASGPKSGGADWTHFNSVDYHEEFDQIVVSVHSFSEIWIIDHSTTTEQAKSHAGGNSGKGGDILYRWGNPQTYSAGTSNDQKLFSQHDATWIEDGYPGAGNILIFNNGQGRSDGTDYSSVDEITPPADAQGNYSLTSGSAYDPADMTWTYSDPSDFYSENISGAQRLSNGNTLICNGANGIFFEVTPDKEIVWKYVNPVAKDGTVAQGEEIPENNGSKTNQVFRVYRYAPGYTGLPGDIASDVKGDMDGDWKITLTDIITVLRICAGEKVSPDTEVSDADVNNDSKIGLEEALYILKKLASL